MGCHTWFAKKIEVSHEEIKSYMLDRIQKDIDFCEKLISDRSSIDVDLLEAYPEWTVEYGQKYKEIFLRQLRFVSKDLCQLAMYHRYSYQDHQTYYEEGRGFYAVTDDMPHDIFRIGGYLLDKLYSYQETIDFIERYKNDGQNKHYVYWFCDDWQERLKSFWEKFPDAQIHFG